jgi:hypothetical protein
MGHQRVSQFFYVDGKDVDGITASPRRPSIGEDRPRPVRHEYLGALLTDKDRLTCRNRAAMLAGGEERPR